MDNSILFTIGLQIALIALNAIFACAEIAVISMNDNKLAIEDSVRVTLISWGTSHRRRRFSSLGRYLLHGAC